MPTAISGIFKALINYLKESRKEVTRVNWPNRQEVLRLTLSVIIFSAFVAAILGGLDYVLGLGLVKLLSP